MRAIAASSIFQSKSTQSRRDKRVTGRGDNRLLIDWCHFCEDVTRMNRLNGEKKPVYFVDDLSAESTPLKKKTEVDDVEIPSLN